MVQNNQESLWAFTSAKRWNLTLGFPQVEKHWHCVWNILGACQRQALLSSLLFMLTTSQMIWSVALN